MVNFSDFNGVIGEEVVNDEGQFVKSCKETEDSAVVVKELLLALHSATSERFFHVLLEAGITDNWLGDLLISETVNGNSLRLTLRLSKVAKKLSCVLITVVDADASTKNSNVQTNSEVPWKHWEARTVLLEDHLSLEEDSLRSATVDLAGLTDHD
jgi:hypothetical protein